MTNFDCDKVIIFYYPIGAGGRFLANNLSLSPDCVMTNSKLAMMQLEGKLNQKQKLYVLMRGLENLNHHVDWNDLGLCDTDWYGIEYDNMPDTLGVNDYHYLSDSDFKTKVYTNKGFQHVTIDNSKYLFLVSHCSDELYKQLSVWKNARVISLKNENLFKYIRRFRNAQPYLKVIWSLIPEEEKVGWTPAPLYKRDFENLPENIQKTVWKYLKDPKFFNKVSELMNIKYSIQVPKLFSEYKKLSQKDKKILEGENTTEEYLYPDSIFVWDCNWYLSEEDTLCNIKKLYDVLELDGYNNSYSKLFYGLWIEKLEELRKYWKPRNDQF